MAEEMRLSKRPVGADLERVAKMVCAAYEEARQGYVPHAQMVRCRLDQATAVATRERVCASRGVRVSMSGETNVRIDVPARCIKETLVTEKGTCGVCAGSLADSVHRAHVTGCCEAHRTHLDCYLVATMSQRAAPRPCVCSAFSSDCLARISVRAASAPPLESLEMRACDDTIKDELRALYTKVAEAAVKYDVAPRGHVGACKDPERECAMCGDELGDDGVADCVSTCDAHVVHARCYVFWRLFVMNGGAKSAETECPHPFIGSGEPDEACGEKTAYALPTSKRVRIAI